MRCASPFITYLYLHTYIQYSRYSALGTICGRWSLRLDTTILQLQQSASTTDEYRVHSATLSALSLVASRQPPAVSSCPVIEEKGRSIPILLNQCRFLLCLLTQELVPTKSPDDRLALLVQQPPFWSCDNQATMRDGTFTTRADVYAQEIPDASDSVIVTSESALLQTSVPVVEYDAPDTERHGQGDRDETRVGEIVDSTATFDEHPASSKRLTSYSESNDTDHRTETIENDVCDASPISQAVALSIAKSAFEFGSDPDGRSDPQTQTDPESRLSRVQRNGLDTDKKKQVVRRNDNSCVVDCIYFTQQCCECVIF